MGWWFVWNQNPCAYTMEWCHHCTRVLHRDCAVPYLRHFLNGIWHVLLWFSEAEGHTSLNHKDICRIPYENASRMDCAISVLAVVFFFRVKTFEKKITWNTMQKTASAPSIRCGVMLDFLGTGSLVDHYVMVWLWPKFWNSRMKCWVILPLGCCRHEQHRLSLWHIYSTITWTVCVWCKSSCKEGKVHVHCL